MLATLKKPTVESVRIVWEEDPTHPAPEVTTAEEHYGFDGAEWAHVSEDEKQEVCRVDGSIWGACERYEREDRARLEAWENDEWHYTGCFAVAKVRSSSGVLQTLRSAGLWGIESDASEEYRFEVESEQLDELKEELAAFGVAVDGLAQYLR